MFYWSKMGRSRLSFMLNSVTQPQNCTTEFLKCVCECVYMCACGCAYVWDGLCVCTWLWRPRDNLEHHPQEHYPPPLETPFLSSMAWRSPMRLRCLARVSQGSTLLVAPCLAFLRGWGGCWEQNLGLHGCIASFLPTESSPQLYGHTNFKVKQLCSTNSNRYPTPELPCALPRIPFYSPTAQSLTQFLLRQADFTSSRTAWSFCLHALGWIHLQGFLCPSMWLFTRVAPSEETHTSPATKPEKARRRNRLTWHRVQKWKTPSLHQGLFVHSSLALFGAEW